MSMTSPEWGQRCMFSPSCSDLFEDTVCVTSRRHAPDVCRRLARPRTELGWADELAPDLDRRLTNPLLARVNVGLGLRRAPAGGHARAQRAARLGEPGIERRVRAAIDRRFARHLRPWEARLGEQLHE